MGAAGVGLPALLRRRLRAVLGSLSRLDWITLEVRTWSLLCHKWQTVQGSHSMPGVANRSFEALLIPACD